MSQANAIVVLCPKRPDLAGQPLLGHVGWGFELPDGQWMVGAVEGDGWANGNGMNGFWSRKVPGEKQATQVFANMVHYGAEYNYFKYLTMTSQVWPDPDAALRVMAWVSAQPYQLFGRNCMNSTYDILRAFSRGGHFNGKILPSPDFNWIPNGWFNAIQVPQRLSPSPSRFAAGTGVCGSRGRSAGNGGMPRLAQAGVSRLFAAGWGARGAC